MELFAKSLYTILWLVRFTAEPSLEALPIGCRDRERTAIWPSIGTPFPPFHPTHPRCGPAGGAAPPTPVPPPSLGDVVSCSTKSHRKWPHRRRTDEILD
ncbi:hypothetical protein V1477_003717 [Vespula maculifrons]|uniref:Secreted protein n=2 Tax=Vespula TaxID=7451 RepID=A0A836XNB9_VESVU|nr:hypothetical protein HZH66_003016 [Vespula vulgaris]